MKEQSLLNLLNISQIVDATSLKLRDHCKRLADSIPPNYDLIIEEDRQIKVTAVSAERTSETKNHVLFLQKYQSARLLKQKPSIKSIRMKLR